MKSLPQVRHSFGALTLLFCLLSSIGSAQKFPFWGDLQPGPHAVGFADTVIFKADELCKFGEHDGGKPFFVSIWYPGIDDDSKHNLKQRDYCAFTSPPQLKAAADTVRYYYKKALQQYGVCMSLRTWRDKKLNRKRKKLTEEILNTQVRAKRGLKPISGDLPCILYHHGGGGTSDENSLFCEYMASNGYIVISSNYHFPEEGKTYLSNNYPTEDLDWITDIHFVTDYAKQYRGVDADQMYYAGHSWGAQSAFGVNSQVHPFKKFILFDTTIEAESLGHAKRRRTYIDSIITHHDSVMTTPMYVVSSERKTMSLLYKISYIDPQFALFRQLKSTPIAFITSNVPLDHESYITQGVVRAVYTDKYRQSDRKIIEPQYRQYLRVLALTKAILEEQDTNLDKMYGTEFRIELLNR